MEIFCFKECQRKMYRLNGLFIGANGKSVFLKLLLINILVVVVCYTMLGVNYATDDDMIMVWISSGCFLGRPDMHLVFANVIYGFVVAGLYKVIPSVEWYTLCLIGFQVVSFSIVQKRIIGMNRGTIGTTLFLVAILLIELSLLHSLTFTTTAGIMATASFLEIGEKTKNGYAIGMILFLLASMVRFSSAMLVGLVFLSFYPLCFYLNGFSRQQFVCLSFCVVLAIGFKVIDRMVYRLDDGWENYYQTNKARSGINDHVDVWRAKSDLPNSVIESDLDLLFLFGFRDAHVFDNQSLVSIHETMDKLTSYKSIPYIKKVKNVFGFLREYLLYWVSIIPLVSIVLITITGGDKRRLLCGVPIIALLVITSFVAMTYIVKERAFLCAYLPFVLYLSFLVFNPGQSKKEQVWLGVALLLSVMPMIKWHSLRLSGRPSDNNTEQLVNYIHENDLKPVLLCWPFDENAMKVSSNYFDYLSNGWTFDMPGRLQIDKLSDFVEDKKIVIIGGDENSMNLYFDKLKTSILFHYGLEVAPKMLKTFDNYVIYAIVEDNANSI